MDYVIYVLILCGSTSLLMSETIITAEVIALKVFKVKHGSIKQDNTSAQFEQKSLLY